MLSIDLQIPRRSRECSGSKAKLLTGYFEVSRELVVTIVKQLRGGGAPEEKELKKTL